MKELVRSAFVIGRRDFTATVYSKTFLLFLGGPLLMIALSIMIGNFGERMARRDLHPTVAVVSDAADFKALNEARERLNPAFGDNPLPDLLYAEPDYVLDAQVRDLLSARDKKVVAVLTGGLDRPTLTGAISESGRVRNRIEMVLKDARQARAMDAAGLKLAAAPMRLVQVEEAAGAVAAMRATTARAGQLLLFMVTVLLAGMLLSNLIEEKSNRVIEVLAAAVPVDAIFTGKLFAMLAVSLVGIIVWATGGFLASELWSEGGTSLPDPAVGWPLFVILTALYYSANYLLLGAVFLGIGSQAASVREVQTISMPVTIAQVLIFFLASAAVGPFNSLIGIAAAAFPFSSPMTMVARAAQTPELWPHLVALAWQALWVWLTIKLAASLFRRNVLKSGSGSEASEPQMAAPATRR
jgi:ABC-2 type transport system permease protein